MTRIKKFIDKLLLRCGKASIAILLAVVFTLSNMQVVFALTLTPDNLMAMNTIVMPPTIGPIGDTFLDVEREESRYILQVATGITPGYRVGFFAVKYKDEKDVVRTHYIIISDNELQTTYSDLARGSSGYGTIRANPSETVVQRIDRVKKTTGYSIPKYDSAIGSNVRALAPNSVDTFLIQTETPIKSVVEISFFASTGTREEKLKEKETGKYLYKNEWSCNDLRFYKVDNIYGVDMYGYYSNKYFIKFDGVEMAAMDTSSGFKNYFWTIDSIIKMNSQDGNGAKLKVGQNTKYSNAKPAQVYFEMGLEDKIGSGIESLATSGVKGEKTLSTMSVAESLILSVIYKDIFGDTRRVDMPYLTSASAWAASKLADANTPIIGLAQQGEKIGFVATLPDLASLVSYQFTYGDKMSREMGLAIPSNAKHNERLAAQDKTKDQLSITYFAAYTNADEALPTAEVVRGSLSSSATVGIPQSYYMQKSDVLAFNGFPSERTFKPYRVGTELDPKDYSNTYLVTVKTDDLGAAGTTSDVSMQLGYINTSGEYKTTDNYQVRDLVGSYYGFWPGAGSDIAYNASLAQGAELRVLITLRDVESFDNVVFTTDGFTIDDWQISNFAIDKVTSISKRGVQWKDFRVGRVQVDRVFERIVESESIVKNETKLFIKGTGESKELSLVSKNVTEVVDDNWTDNRYLMSFEEASKNLGFAKTRHYYTVSVEVANERNATMNNDDCGSKNLFYFQLIFKAGRSGYVLANQQISSDGFRAGGTEIFTISVNQNYGELVSVNIIPDDVSSTSNVFDKLKIDNILITKDSVGGLSKQWGVTNVGWVSIDYRDEAESSKKTGRPARSETEMARNFPITSSAFVMNLLFTVTTSINKDFVEVDKEAGDKLDDKNYVIDKNGQVKGKQFAQLKGTVMADLNYADGTGQDKIMTFDMVDAMYKFAALPTQYATNDYGESLNRLGDPALSDPSFMFRSNHTDRFVISVGDISKLHSITFHPISVGSTTWFVESVSASLIDSDGTLSINANNDYETSSSVRTIAESAGNGDGNPYAQICTKEATQGLTVPFLENEVKIEKVDEETWSAAVTREPSSTNDTLNVFIYTTEQTNTFKLKTSLLYTDKRGSMNQISTGDLLKKKQADGGYTYYSIGMPANNLATLDRMIVKANSGTIMTNYVTHAVVQRVRSGVMISSYRFLFESHNSANDLSVKPKTATSATTEGETQTVTFKLGLDMEGTTLVKMNRDVAIAINYTTTSDAREVSYMSPYIYLTDEQYKEVSPGDTFSITFRQPYLKEITGLKLITTGGLKLPVESAYVTTSVSSANTGFLSKLTGWYSFPYAKFTINSSSDMIPPTSKGLDALDALSSVNLKIIGGEAADGEEAKKAARLDETPMRVTIGYTNMNDELVEETFGDIRMHKLATKGSSESTSTPTTTPQEKVASTPNELLANVVLSGVKAIKWVRIDPYDLIDTSTTSIYVKEVSASIATPTSRADVFRKIYFDNVILENATQKFQVSFTSLGIGLDVTSRDFLTDKEATVTESRKDVDIASRGRRTVYFRPFLIPTDIPDSEFTIKVQQKISDRFVDISPEILKNSMGYYEFLLPRNDTQVNVEYCIRISSIKETNEQVKLNITVVPESVAPSDTLNVSFTTLENIDTGNQVNLGLTIQYTDTDGNEKEILTGRIPFKENSYGEYLLENIVFPKFAKFGKVFVTSEEGIDGSLLENEITLDWNHSNNTHKIFKFNVPDILTAETPVEITLKE